MERSEENAIEENRQLRRTMRDIVALSTLPAIWIGLDASGIARSLADVLRNTLSLDLIYIRFAGLSGEGSVEVVRGKNRNDAEDLDAIKLTLTPILESDGRELPTTIVDPSGAGTLRIAVTRFGVGDNHGILVVGSRKADFPNERDRLLLGVGANQTAIVLQRRRAEEQTQEQRERLRVTLASIGDAVLTTDTDGRVTFLNPVAESLTGRTMAEALGQPLEAVFHIINEQTRAPVENPVTKVLREGKVVGLANHTIIIAKDGTERPIDDSAAPIRGKAGEIVGCVLVFRDITDKKQAEAQVRHAGEQARTILESVTDAFFALDRDWRFTYVNRQATRVLERTKEQLLGSIIWEAFPGLAGSDFERAYHRAVTERVPVSVLAFYPDHRRWYDVHAYPASNGISVYFRDVTEQRQVDSRIREAEDQVRVMADNIPQLAWMTNAEGAIVWYNRRWYEYTGTTFDEMQAHGWQSVLSADDEPRVLAGFQRQLACGEPWEDTFRLRRHDGEMRWHLSRALPIKDEAGRVLRWFGTNTDITEQRKLAADLADADRRKNEFLATLAHELRNPLAPIRTGLQVLRLAGQDPNAIEQTRAMIDRQVGQMVRLVDDLMDVSRISTGKIELRKDRVPLSVVVNSAVETSRPLIEQMGHALTVSLPKEPVIIDADLTRLAQVFLNLLNNAAKYSDRGGHIRLTAERHGSGLVVSVRDTGIGIPAEHLPQVFDMFSQVERSLEKSQGGLGIGLTLVKRLVEMHGGSVEARSAGLNRGSEFVVRLPVAVQASQTDSAGARNDASTAPKSSLRILIVDDNRDGADTLAMMLEIVGNHIRTAYDGEEALAATAEFKPDVILLDIGLPKLTGYEACRRIREQPGGKQLLIIAQTGWGQEEDRQRTRQAGFDHHLVKPVDPQALMKLLAEVQLRRG
jgi:PAS domain S-box-containing protein